MTTHAVDWWGDPALVIVPDDHDDLIERPPWHRRALCRGTMVDGYSLWFSPNARDRAQARVRCLVCPVQVECASYAQEWRGPQRVGSHGVWAGEG